MYLWRFSIAITLGLVWYCSDYGHTLIECLCFLFCISTPLLPAVSGRESGTQTDEEAKDDTVQETAVDNLIDGDTPDLAVSLESPYPHVKRSLQQVFECAYAQLVLPWYTVPESCEQQPLHQVLGREFDFVIDRIIERAKDFDVSHAVVGSIRILTQHLHNAKQSDRQLLFRSRAEEIVVLRELSDALVRNLFRKSLWGQEVNRCALNEIIALKGLGHLVAWLSDPDNLNQLVVSQLAIVTPKNSVEELYGSDTEKASLASQESKGEGGDSDVSSHGTGISDGTRTKGKRKGNKLKEGWSKFVDKMKSKKAKKKKMKKMEQKRFLKITAYMGDLSSDDNVSSREGSIRSQEEEDSDGEDGDMEDYLTAVQEDMIEFKLSYEMWRVGRWAVSIPNADWEDEKLIFTVHLEEKDSPENLQWDIKKSYMDIVHFSNRWQEIAVLKDVRALQMIPGELVKPFKSNFPSRLAESRAELVEKLLIELGTENSGFTLENVMTFCTAALEHSASTVRELAVRIILSVYQKERSAVLSYLPPNDAGVRKNFLYKNLFDGFAKIDGKLVETQTLKKGGGQLDRQKEKEEIHSLQEQLAALKEITERGNESTKGQTAKREVHKAEKESQKAGKGTVTKGSQNKMIGSGDFQQSINCLDNLCIFCGKKDESFTEEGLDLHYWKHCPMLRRCDECRQVVEIASLTEHLLGECENRSKFSQCPLCSEAVATEDLTYHAQGPGCNPPVLGKGSNHCPLCHSNFTPGEEAWKAHLMGREGCKQNSRRTAASQRTQPAQGRAFGGTKLKQVWSYGARARARPMGRGSRIPSLAPLARGYPPGKR